jgi:antitoxin component YwqK of YwqJK toxin-antitoxin module
MSEAQVDAHLKKFAPVQRKILTELRDHIAVKLPTSEQVIKYGIPTFLINGLAVVGFDGYKGHNSIFPYSGSFNSGLKKELEKYEQTKGSIHFDLTKSIPKPHINKILDERIKQINDSYPKKTGESLEFYSNGVLKAKGKFKNKKLHGDWQWFRKTGVIMRSGSFKNGTQVGAWTTYDVNGLVYKVTNFSSSE